MLNYPLRSPLVWMEQYLPITTDGTTKPLNLVALRSYEVRERAPDPRRYWRGFRACGRFGRLPHPAFWIWTHRNSPSRHFG